MDQIIPIALVGGLDTKTDDKSVTPDKLLVLENGVFENPKRIEPRPGYDSLGNSIIGGGSISSASGIASNLNSGQLFTLGQGKAYGYSKARSAFKDSGNVSPVTMSSFSEYVGAVGPGDICSIGSYDVICYGTNTLLTGYSGVQILIRDNITNEVLYQTQRVTDGVTARLVAWGGFAYLVEWSSITFRISKIDPTIASPIVATATPTPPASNTPGFDVMVTANGLFLTYHKSRTVISAILYDANLNVIHSHDETVSNASTFNEMSVAFDSVNNRYFIFDIRSGGLYWLVLDSSFTLFHALTQIPTITQYPSIQMERVSALCVAPNQVVVLAQGTPTSLYPTVFKFNVSATAVTFTDFYFCTTGELCSKIVFTGAKYYVVLGYVSADTFPETDPGFIDSNQNTFYLQEVTIASASDVSTLGFSARFFIANAAPMRNITASGQAAIIPELVLIGTTFVTVLPVLTTFGSFTVANPTYVEINKVVFDLNDQKHASINQTPDANILVSGAIATTIDDTASEELFNVFPEQLVLTASSVGTGVLPAGTYQYFALYEWVDARGQIHQSSPSQPATITLGSPSNVDIQYYQFLNTTKITPINFIIYRTTANTVTPFKLTLPVLLLINPSPRTDVTSIATITDNTPDASITRNQILYTAGGILPNDPAPSSQFQWVYKYRVFLGGLDDGNQIMFSKQRVEGAPIKFSAEFTLNVDISGGPVTAGGTLDDKCIFFKKNRIFYMYGDGPNDAGTGGTFSAPQEVSSPVGCQYPKSVVQMPQGLMFKSEKGIYLLDRGLNATYIGYGVESFNQYDVTASLHMAKFNQVRFFLSNGTCLMYDYLVGQWSTFTNTNGVGACLFQNQLTFIQPTGAAMQEDESIFLDNGSAVPMTIETPWYKLSSLQGFQRAKAFLLMMNRNSSNSITVQVAYDYETTFYQLPFSWVPLAGNEPDQVRLFLNRQKCESIKIRISDNATATSGQGYSLSEISLLAMMKRGQFKVQSTKSVGTTSA